MRIHKSYEINEREHTRNFTWIKMSMEYELHVWSDPRSMKNWWSFQRLCWDSAFNIHTQTSLSLSARINKQRMRSTAQRPDARTKEMDKTRRKNNSQNSERRREKIANEWASACAQITTKQWCKSATPTSVCRKKVPVPRNAWVTEWDWEQKSDWASVRHANLFMELSAKTVFFSTTKWWCRLSASHSSTTLMFQYFALIELYTSLSTHRIDDPLFCWLRIAIYHIAQPAQCYVHHFTYILK